MRSQPLYGDLKQTKADPLDDTSNFKANQSMRKVFQSQSVNEYVKTFKKVVHEVTDLQIESPCWPDSIWLPRGLCILYTQHTILAFLFSQGSRLTGTKTLKLVTEFKYKWSNAKERNWEVIYLSNNFYPELRFEKARHKCCRKNEQIASTRLASVTKLVSWPTSSLPLVVFSKAPYCDLEVFVFA